MKKVGVLFGGKSVEHEVSIITGMQVMENMDSSEYEPIPIYITKEGKWLSDPSFRDFTTFKNWKEDVGTEVFFRFGSSALYCEREGQGGLFGKKGPSVEVYDTPEIYFPALHGTYGEDGAVQGLLETLQVPYVGAGVAAGALGMDKVLMKKVFEAEGLPVLPYRWFYRSEWKKDSGKVLSSLGGLSYPLFVKPANLGSSIGITMVKEEKELREAIDLAASYDRKIIVEQGAKNPRECNMAVLGYEGEFLTSVAEEPMGWTDLLSFADKYVKGSKNKGGKGKKPEANLSPELLERMEVLSKKAMAAIDAMGTARIDFLLEGDDLFINEINTLPGSVAFYLWEGKGISFRELLTLLLKEGEERYAQRKETTFRYDANLLELTKYGAKLG